MSAPTAAASGTSLRSPADIIEMIEASIASRFYEQLNIEPQ